MLDIGSFISGNSTTEVVLEEILFEIGKYSVSVLWEQPQQYTHRM